MLSAGGVLLKMQKYFENIWNIFEIFCGQEKQNLD